MSFLYFLFFFFFNDTATTEIYTLSLHDALPISVMSYVEAGAGIGVVTESVVPRTPELRFVLLKPVQSVPLRSEEHTSELQSQSNLVCRLLLEKKKKKNEKKTIQKKNVHTNDHDV